MVNYTKEELEEAVKKSFNIGQVVKELSGAISGGRYRTTRKYIELWNIDISHFDPNHRHKKTGDAVATPLEDILVENSTYRGKGQQIKNKLLREGIFEDTCVECNISNIYNNKPIVLQLDHINGDHSDNRIENLRILCPNCHTQTKTWGNKKR